MRTIFKPTARNFSGKPVTNIISLVGLSTSLDLVIRLKRYDMNKISPVTGVFTTGRAVLQWRD